MVCDLRLRPRQTPQQRKSDIQKAIEKLTKDIVSGKVKPTMGPNGSVSFKNWAEADRDGITDECALRRILSGNNMMAKMALAQAEQLAGRKFNVNGGFHAHGD